MGNPAPGFALKCGSVEKIWSEGGSNLLEKSRYVDYFHLLLLPTDRIWRDFGIVDQEQVFSEKSCFDVLIGSFRFKLSHNSSPLYAIGLGVSGSNTSTQPTVLVCLLHMVQTWAFSSFPIGRAMPLT